MPMDPNTAVPLKSLVFWLDSVNGVDDISMARRYWMKRDYEGYIKLNGGGCPWCATGKVVFDTIDKEGQPIVINGVVIDRVQCYCRSLKQLCFSASRWYESTYMDTYLDNIRPLALPNQEAAKRTEQIVGKLKKFLWNPTRSALIHGKTGTGKSTMLQAIKTAFGGFAVYITFNDLFDKVMSFVRSDQDSLSSFTDHLKYAPVLLLDDFGLQHQTEWTTSVIAAIINHRYELKRYAPTIMTTNRSMAEILAAVNSETGIDNTQRIFSRMIDSQNSTVMTVLQDDYRNKVNLVKAGVK